MLKPKVSIFAWSTVGSVSDVMIVVFMLIWPLLIVMLSEPVNCALISSVVFPCAVAAWAVMLSSMFWPSANVPLFTASQMS